MPPKKTSKKTGSHGERNKKNRKHDDDDDEDVYKITYFSNSKDAPLGHGSNEKYRKHPTEAEKKIVERIQDITDWRKILSNFHSPPNPFKYKNKKYGTVEACFQAQKLLKFDAPGDKIKPLYDPDLPGNEAQKAGQKKHYPLTPEQLEEWDKVRDATLLDCQRAALAGDKQKRAILADLARLNAQIFHIPGQRQKAQRDDKMEALAREMLAIEEGKGKSSSSSRARSKSKSRSRSPKRKSSPSPHRKQALSPHRKKSRSPSREKSPSSSHYRRHRSNSVISISDDD